MVEAPILWLFDTVLPREQAGSSLRDIGENIHGTPKRLSNDKFRFFSVRSCSISATIAF